MYMQYTYFFAAYTYFRRKAHVMKIKLYLTFFTSEIFTGKNFLMYGILLYKRLVQMYMYNLLKVIELNLVIGCKIANKVDGL